MFKCILKLADNIIELLLDIKRYKVDDPNSVRECLPVCFLMYSTKHPKSVNTNSQPTCVDTNMETKDDDMNNVTESENNSELFIEERPDIIDSLKNCYDTSSTRTLDTSRYIIYSIFGFCWLDIVQCKNAPCWFSDESPSCWLLWALISCTVYIFLEVFRSFYNSQKSFEYISKMRVKQDTKSPIDNSDKSINKDIDDLAQRSNSIFRLEMIFLAIACILMVVYFFSKIYNW